MNRMIKAAVVGVAAVGLMVGCSNAPPGPPSKPVVVTPVARVQVNDGRYLVGTATVGNIVPMPPGRYQTNGLGSDDPGMGKCTWSTSWSGGAVFAGAGFAEGVTSVQILSGQQFEVRGGCTWIQQP